MCLSKPPTPSMTKGQSPLNTDDTPLLLYKDGFTVE